MKRYVILLMLFSVFCIPLSAQTDAFKLGAATKVINNDTGKWVQGAGVPKKATKIRDDLEANSIYLSNEKTQLLLVSLDLVGLESSFAVKLREAMGVAAGIPPRNILLSCTHTHGGPSLVKTNYLMDIDTVYMNRLEGWLVDLAKESVTTARPAKIGWAKGEAQIGFNRRLTWADGTHTMHGDATRKDFTGLEGPDDPQHLALFATDMKGDLRAILYHNTSHPTIFYGAGIYSADFPGEVRRQFRERFGKNLPVLFLNGAQGDISIDNMLDRPSENREEKLERISKLVVDETMRLYKDIIFDDNPIMKHEYEDLKVSVRLPTPDKLMEGREILYRIDAGENIRGMKMIMAFGAVHLQETFGEHPFDTLPIHALRIEDLAIVTQPCELYCRFGLDIKRRSPSKNTIVVGLTDGYGGYCPTIYGLLGGGYSGEPISWTRLEPYAGYQIVEHASSLLNTLWQTE